MRSLLVIAVVIIVVVVVVVVVGVGVGVVVVVGVGVGVGAGVGVAVAVVVVVVVVYCLLDSLLIAELHAYGFDKTYTEYLKDYLSHRKLKIKIDKLLSNWTNILHGAPQGFILCPLIFNANLCDLFLFKPNIDLISYADDNTPFAMSGSSELEVINEIKDVVESLTFWFRNNCMKVNPDKFHFLLSRKKSHQMDICN